MAPPHSTPTRPTIRLHMTVFSWRRPRSAPSGTPRRARPRALTSLIRTSNDIPWRALLQRRRNRSRCASVNSVTPRGRDGSGARRPPVPGSEGHVEGERLASRLEFTDALPATGVWVTTGNGWRDTVGVAPSAPGVASPPVKHGAFLTCRDRPPWKPGSPHPGRGIRRCRVPGAGGRASGSCEARRLASAAADGVRSRSSRGDVFPARHGRAARAPAGG
jgi:hypothetical protein